MNDIIQKIRDNYDKIVGIELDGNFYNVDYISLDVKCYDLLDANDIALHCYTINTDRNVTENYYFIIKDIKNAKEVKLYELKEIKDGQIQNQRY